MLVQHVSVDHQTEVATVLNAVERVASAAREIDSGLRIALYEFEFGRRQRILERITVLKLSEPYAEGIVNLVVGIELLHHARKIVHEQE